MAKDFAKAFYKSKRWNDCRASYISSVHGLCERCLAKGKHIPGFILHHTVYLNERNINDPMISLNFEHLEYLCQECHNKEHFGDAQAIGDGLMFDDDGDLIEN